MKFQLSKSDQARLQKLFTTKELNLGLSQLILDLIDGFENETISTDFLEIRTKTQYLNKIKQLFEYDPHDRYHAELMKKLDQAIKNPSLIKYTKNPYNLLIKPSTVHNQNLQLDYRYYQRNEIFVFDDLTSDGPYFEEKLSLAYSAEPFSYLALLEKHQIWMAIIPHEINTMNHAIQEASGNVIVLGLGLGYFPFMISLKPEVKSIVIVENNQTIIDIFKELILDKFPNKNKVKLVKGDAFTYLQKHHHEFDYGFFDIYRNSEDGLPLYLKAKRQEAIYPNLKISYWLEASLIAKLRRIVISYFEEVYFQYKIKGKSPLDDIMNLLAEKLKNTTFTSFEQIVTQLETINLLALFQ